MKTITNCEARPRKRRLLLSLLCAGVVATFLGGCAEGPYVTAYDSGYYYPTSYYTPDYDYYGPTYSRTIVRSGVRDRKSTRLNSSHVEISYAVFCLKKKKI